MAGNAKYTAVLDACVLYSVTITDALMSIAVKGLYAPKWTKKIEQEWICSLEENRPDLKGRLGIRQDCMREVIPDWEIPEASWSSLESSLILPDPNDRHVLAAAICGHADCIVTKNKDDFPLNITSLYGIEIIDPDQFIIHQWDLESIPVMAAFKEMRARRKKPIETVEMYAQTLEKNGLPATAQKIREAKELI
jgi:hypothetical protein